MKNRSHRYDIYIDLGLDIDTNYSKYKKGCINQDLSNIRSSIDEKDKQHWGSIE